MGTAIDGKTAAGNAPLWIIQAAAFSTTPPASNATSIALTVVTGGDKLDCHMDFGDFTIGRTPTTRSRQRMCQKIAEEIVVGNTIAGTLSAIWDQQAAAGSTVNEAYDSLAEGSEVYIFQAFGQDSDTAPTTATKGDLWRVTVAQVDHTQPANAEEDLKFTATLSGSAYWPDISLT